MQPQQFWEVVHRSALFIFAAPKICPPHPARLHKEDGIKSLLLDIQNVMGGAEYKEMVEISKKKSEELAKLKYNRDQARKNLRKGRSDSKCGVDSDLAAAFKAGTLVLEVNRLQEQFGYRKRIGMAALLG